jgi:hypothetical protein
MHGKVNVNPMLNTLTLKSIRLWICSLGLLLAGLPPLLAEQDTTEVEFFESRIRPILAQDCYECHRSKGPQKGGLALDHRDALRRGGDSGPAIVPGQPADSLLIQAIHQTSEDLQMPKSGAKLEASVIADFEAWIAKGAVDPRDHPPSEEELETDTNWEAVMERRKQWWSFQPIKAVDIPYPPDATRHMHPVDAFIADKLKEAGLKPSEEANGETLIRRLSLILRGLPPSPEEIEAFLADQSPNAYVDWVDTFLSSPQFGERWARHWMDWVRYAESHGSEGDPMIPNAWLYRDYLIRALNNDIPYDQLLLEHLAGDLVAHPRINEELGLNESAIGTAQLRMVFHGFAPTDALDEQVRFTDDQINVVSKAFQGITVSCARCHDHKFEPISQKDFYAWYGIMASGRPAMIQVNVPPTSEADLRVKMEGLKASIKEEIIKTWMIETEQLNPDSDVLLEALKQSKKGDVLWPLSAIETDRKEVLEAWKALREQANGAETSKRVHHWNLADPSDASKWFAEGPSATRPAHSGTWALSTEGESIVQNILPSGTYSHLVSTKDRGLLHSPRIQLDQPYDLWLLVNGDGNAMARYAVQNYPRDGTVYPVERMNGSRWHWRKFPLDYWKGDQIHIEITTAADQPVLARLDQTRSWFGIRNAVIVPSNSPFNNQVEAEIFRPVLAETKDELPESQSELLAIYRKSIFESLTAWKNKHLTDAQAVFLDAILKSKILTNQAQEGTSIAKMLEEWRRFEKHLATPMRSPGQFETEGFDQVLFDRGDHKKPLDVVPRRFLEFLDDEPYQTKSSGRLELAQDMLRDDNPLTSRVIVNRIWHHLFGKGIVATPDNFGKLGLPPTHPELLDFLAAHFKNNGWSIKNIIRFLVTSETWKRSSDTSDLAAARDPDNQLWSHFSVRRLEAEAIRDSLLAVSGKLDRDTQYGSPVNGNSPRRSVYVRVKRNDLDPFLTLFDAPVPASTRGRRDATNVPGQSLSMLNDRFVIDCAEKWVSGLAQIDPSVKGTHRNEIQSLFLKALGRYPNLSETIRAEQFLAAMHDLKQDTTRQINALSDQVKETEAALVQLEETTRKRVLEGRDQDTLKTAAPGPAPFASWNFSSGLKDEIGGLDLELLGEARLEGGALKLNGKGSYARSKAFQKDIKEKTLEAWVQLDDLDQRGGGVMSLQDTSGSTFDAIVYGEQTSRKWLAGSNVFARTQNLHGEDEHTAHQEWVHIALTYQVDGTITAYRNGTQYGKPYRSDGPVTFSAGNAQLLLGNRHGSPGGNRLLRGQIAKARFYDRALSSEEIKASFNGDPHFVSQKDLLAALNEEELSKRNNWLSQINTTKAALESIQSKQGLSHAWADLAHAIFNLKEFIYVQ